MILFLWQSMVSPVYGESGDNTLDVSVAKVQTPVEQKLITVQPGETLSGIARKYQTTVSQITSVNKITNPDEIKVGQKLWVQTQEAEVPIEEIKDGWGNLFFLNHILVPVLARNSEEKSLPEKVKESIQTVEFLVNGEEKVDAEVPSNTLSRGSEFSNEEIELLARVIHGEARGEDFEGQVAVGAVVVNRMNDPRFPKTIRDVIYQKGAFTAVADKQIHLTPDDEAYRAALAALEGKDPTGGAIYYYNPRTATDRWIKSRPVIKQIGNHTFSI